MQPEMVVAAGPPGSGKSTFLRPEAGEIDYFNADERARELNHGSGRKISPEIRATVNRELEEFIADHIRQRRSFSFETTLRTAITFEQARSARRHGFRTFMDYVALASAEECINRVRKRTEHDGHSAPPERVREIYVSSLRNLSAALQEFDYVRVFDNTNFVVQEGPKLLIEAVNGSIVSLASDMPGWTLAALRGTANEITEELRNSVKTISASR